MITENTFRVTIYVGFKEHYDGKIQSIEEAENICQEYCNKVGLCATITPLKFVYKDGEENGCAIGLINYPRFPSSEETILNHGLQIGKLLMKEFNQMKVSIVCDDKTYMLEESDLIP